MAAAVIEVKYFNTFCIKKVGIRGMKIYNTRPEPNYGNAQTRY